MDTADSEMLPMPLKSKQADLSDLASDLAYHLGWEFFLTDHNIELQRALDSIPPGEVPDLSSEGPVMRKKIVKELYELWQKLWEKSFEQRRYDTVAVGIVRGGKEILVAANLTKHGLIVEPNTTGVKQKGKTAQPSVVNLREDEIFSKHYKVSELGLHDGRHEENIRHIADAFPQLRGTTITLLVPADRPNNRTRKPSKQNRFPHAEMQIFKYATDNGLSIDVVGISKLACLSCGEVLKEKNIKYSHAKYGHLDFRVDDIEAKVYENWGDPRISVHSDGRRFPKIQAQARINIERLPDAGVIECRCTADGTDCSGCQGKVME